MKTEYMVGKGELVVSLGSSGGQPAVFIRPADRVQPHDTPITDGPDNTPLNKQEPDEIVFIFPDEQWRDRFESALFSGSAKIARIEPDSDSLEKTKAVGDEVPYWAMDNPGIVPPDTTGIEVEITIHESKDKE